MVLFTAGHWENIQSREQEMQCDFKTALIQHFQQKIAFDHRYTQVLSSALKAKNISLPNMNKLLSILNYFLQF